MSDWALYTKAEVERILNQEREECARICNRRHFDHEHPSDALEDAWLNDKYADEREDLTLDLPDSTIYELMKQAHELDITFNQLVENILREEIKK